ncbi:hypothetical protein [Hyalangium rubrum]|uniref:Lipoprotein n=1 Tax=Hyalangium rubrum TaxID=3103134 RepID=A0ABU5HDM2_9BACT|nr:hypothetical protein [Hyalangium sp. s54d21]MDY7231232.1 hypothetical protein [Hyalangium sp. s54d21]
MGLLLVALTSSSAWAQQPPKPAEQKPPEQKPAEQKPAEQKPAEQKPAEQKPPEKKAREDYLRALEKLARGQGGTVENVFILGKAASLEHLAGILEWDDALAHGRVPKKRFERELPGFLVGTSEALYVLPDTRFFLEAAQLRGTDVDRRFFDLLHQTFQGTPTRIYVDHITDVAGCYQLGSREFISLYRGWTQFQASYPNAYRDTVKEELFVLEQTMLLATCACGTRQSVDAGFEAFLKAFPKSPIAKGVRERLEKLHTNTSDLVFQCGQELNLPQPLPAGVEPRRAP